MWKAPSVHLIWIDFQMPIWRYIRHCIWFLCMAFLLVESSVLEQEEYEVGCSGIGSSFVGCGPPTFRVDLSIHSSCTLMVALPRWVCHYLYEKAIRCHTLHTCWANSYSSIHLLFGTLCSLYLACQKVNVFLFTVDRIQPLHIEKVY